MSAKVLGFALALGACGAPSVIASPPTHPASASAPTAPSSDRWVVLTGPGPVEMPATAEAMTRTASATGHGHHHHGAHP